MGWTVKITLDLERHDWETLIESVRFASDEWASRAIPLNLESRDLAEMSDAAGVVLYRLSCAINAAKLVKGGVL